MLIILPYGAVVGAVLGVVWTFALAISFSTGISRGAIIGTIIGVVLLLFGVAAHAGGNLKRQEVSFVMCSVMSGIGLVGVVVGLVVWLARAIF